MLKKGRKPIGIKCSLNSHSCHDARIMVAKSKRHYFQSLRLGLLSVSASPSPSTTPAPNSALGRNSGSRQRQRLPLAVLQTPWLCSSLRACAHRLHVTQTSAQARQAYGCLHFVLRNDLRSALA